MIIIIIIIINNITHRHRHLGSDHGVRYLDYSTLLTSGREKERSDAASPHGTEQGQEPRNGRTYSTHLIRRSRSTSSCMHACMHQSIKKTDCSCEPNQVVLNHTHVDPYVYSD